MTATKAVVLRVLDRVAACSAPETPGAVELSIDVAVAQAVKPAVPVPARRLTRRVLAAGWVATALPADPARDRFADSFDCSDIVVHCTAQMLCAVIAFTGLALRVGCAGVAIQHLIVGQ